MNIFKYTVDGYTLNYIIKGSGKEAEICITETKDADLHNVSVIKIPEKINSIPVTEIGENAFYSDMIESVILPEGLRKIGKSAFEYCHILEEIVIPSTVEKIEEDAFHNCSTLRKIILNEGLKEIGCQAFAHTNLKNLDCPDSLEVIHNNAFEDTSLVSVNFGKNLRMIGDNAFYCCVDLESVAFREGLTYIGAYVFSNNVRKEESVRIHDMFAFIKKRAKY